ncbi:hypothetical protein [Microbacterium elymi]|uniref:DipZ thioredoxin-like C-terminal domain-containing protein n=1 Tax=Microbacterium elymi TaxID=2909587 RepID=A0ABY5NMS7_9MICO|nr:hypothetical protein [Microbacterium elymi]UUT36501.1 hypothetical protein L2X98_19915 [Microbacterium elymi]
MPDRREPRSDASCTHGGRRPDSESRIHHARDVPRVLQQRNFAGSAYPDGASTFHLPGTQPADTFALDGSWTIGSQSATPTEGTGRMRLRYHAGTVRMVLGGTGTVKVRQDGGSWRDVDVSGVPRSYAVVTAGDRSDATLEVQVPAGVDVYSFTFG